MGLIQLYQTGHMSSCVNRDACRCTAFQYFISGIGAFVAAGITAYIGSWSSLAILSESPHALIDGAGDFFALGMTLWYGRAISRNETGLASRLILGLLLIASAIWIGHEGYERIWMPEYPISTMWASIAAALACGIHSVRLLVLRFGGSYDQIHDGVVRHAKADQVHAAIVASFTLLVTFVVWIGADLPLRWLDLSVTAGLIVYMLYQSYRIIRGEGCGHDHGPGEHHNH